MTLCPGTSSTVFLERWRAGDGAGALVKATEQGFVVVHVPDSVLHLLESDHLAIQGLGQELLAAVQTERAHRAHATDFEVAKIGRWDGARGVFATTDVKHIPDIACPDSSSKRLR